MKNAIRWVNFKNKIISIIVLGIILNPAYADLNGTINNFANALKKLTGGIGLVLSLFVAILFIMGKMEAKERLSAWVIGMFIASASTQIVQWIMRAAA